MTTMTRCDSRADDDGLGAPDIFVAALAYRAERRMQSRHAYLQAPTQCNTARAFLY